MAEEIKDLIEKIQQEGIQVAESKAKKIEEEAIQKAKVLIENAKIEAEKIIAEAKTESAKIEENIKTLLKQAARDLFLGLRKEINAMLDRIIAFRISQSLNSEELARIISELIKNYPTKEKEEVIVLLKKEDEEKLRDFFLGELKEKTKQQIALKPSDDISGGFIISYDSGKSYFDFTDKSIASYIGLYLKPSLNELLQGL